MLSERERHLLLFRSPNAFAIRCLGSDTVRIRNVNATSWHDESMYNELEICMYRTLLTSMDKEINT